MNEYYRKGIEDCLLALGLEDKKTVSDIILLLERKKDQERG